MIFGAQVKRQSLKRVEIRLERVGRFNDYLRSEEEREMYSLGKLLIDFQKIGIAILLKLAADCLDAANGRGNQPRIQAAKRAVDLDVAIITLGGKSDQFIGAHEAAEAETVGAARRTKLKFIDNKAGQITVPFE